MQPELVGHLVRNRWRYTTVIKEWNLCLERLTNSKFHETSQVFQNMVKTKVHVKHIESVFLEKKT